MTPSSRNLAALRSLLRQPVPLSGPDRLLLIVLLKGMRPPHHDGGRALEGQDAERSERQPLAKRGREAIDLATVVARGIDATQP